MLLPFELSLALLEVRDLQALSLTCRGLCRLARDEMRRRTYALARVAYACMKTNTGLLVMAGSMPLWLCMGGPTAWFPRDVDLFWHGGKWQTTEEDGDICGLLLEADGKAWWLTFMYDIRPLVKTVETRNGRVQVIMSSHFETPRDVIESFDLTCCRIASTEPGSYTVLEHFSTESFHILACSAETVCKSGGTGPEMELVRLAWHQTQRSEARAAKYEARGLKNLGHMPATTDVLTFSVLYQHTCCCVYENRLVEPHPTNLRNACTCKVSDNCYVERITANIKGGKVESYAI